MTIRLTEAVAQAIASEFFSSLEDEERDGIGGRVDVQVANARLAAIAAPDPDDVADAIWNAIDGVDKMLPEECFVELVDVVDRRWVQILEVAA